MGRAGSCKLWGLIQIIPKHLDCRRLIRISSLPAFGRWISQFGVLTLFLDCWPPSSGLLLKFLTTKYANIGPLEKSLSIWVEVIRMGNMHFLCHFLSVFMVTWSQNELSESWTKITQLTSTLRRVIDNYFYNFVKLSQLKIKGWRYW